MDLTVIGTGYVGLVTGACMAEMGHFVTCVDIDQAKINGLKKGVIPIYEPGLGEIVQRNIAAGRLEFTTEIRAAPVCFLCLPTPAKVDGSADLSYLNCAVHDLAEKLENYTILINKSTVPVGTADHVKQIVAKVTDTEIDVVSNPEFLKEGAAVADCMKPDRIIIGTDSLRAEKVMREIYAPFNMRSDRLILTDVRSSEMIKYAANGMLATRITFMNEIAELCEKMGADIHAVRHGIGSDRRIGDQFLYAGTGFGGSCFPKDLEAIRSMAEKHGVATPLLDGVDARNHIQKKVIGGKIDRYFARDGGLKGKVIAVLGLSFKPDTDDIREAPALELISFLRIHGAKVRLFDPIAMPNTESHLGQQPEVTYCKSELDAAEGADAIALMTEWKQFRSFDLDEALEKMQGCAFFDGRNVYSRETMEKKGFHYFGIGTGKDKYPAASTAASG